MSWSAAGRFLTFALLAVILIGAIAAVAILRHGISAADEPTATERVIARGMRHFATPMAARAMKNPVALNDAAIAEGRAHWADHCAGCHANDGSGKSEIGQRLYPKAPDMRQADTQQLSDGELFFIIKNGVRLTGMPAWGGEDADSWKLVHFIRHLPRVTPAELERMKGMNPVSPLEAQEKKEEEEFLEGKN